ncbi:Na(+)/H(+) antiporter subunit B [Anaerobacillus isosaccharinicus]|uniref:Na(+)/H(+) antiporter subunit B n=1 Tax=Anaerobacillus isosaccharinicus TaxID=1532552 RepID=A0A1S2LRT2_9BACI|nr:Na(+)/H(+) antiporter subunit B [Anaerobacillus isosaccharinicus]MBA5585458.1 Na(+)/H(+) antiporter subunit B [Anaerobacillus isosaccharinicus]QOY36224.1 Na(+)/H(+) antiporter subunit B [Anaerobacillus isosaccharinicus]
MRKNLLMLHTVTRIVVFIILAFSVFLFFAGHNNPGGGFIGGLMTAAALLLLYVAFDVKTIKQVIPFNYTTMIAVGLLIAIGTGVASMLNGDPFLTQYDRYVTVPVLGELHLTTALPFDLGVYLVVVGVALLSILSIAEDDA